MANYIKEELILNALEEYFKQEGISYKRLPEEAYKTPDYEVFLKRNNNIFVEFKEFEFTESDRRLNEMKIFTTSGPLGIKRVRNKIKECSKQFERYQDKPTLCVFNNRGNAYVDLSPIAITEAMFGDIYFSLLIDLTGKTSAIEEGFKYGRNAPSQILRKDGGSLISAIGVLEKIYPNPNVDDFKWRLIIIHNPYAKIPLPKNIFRGRYDEEWIYEDNLGFKKL